MKLEIGKLYQIRCPTFMYDDDDASWINYEKGTIFLFVEENKTVYDICKHKFLDPNGVIVHRWDSSAQYWFLKRVK